MLATSVRVSPWRALCRFSSDGRPTTTVLSWKARDSSGWIVRLISPRGPFTVIRWPSTRAVTPAGSGTGRRPMRDIPGLLPDYREQLAAHAGGAGFPIGHHTLRRAEDRHPQAVPHPRDLARLDVAPQAGCGNALQLADDGGIVVVLEVEPQQAVTPIVQDLVVLDIMVVAEDPRDLDLQLRNRHVDAPVARLAGVAHPGEHVGDRISHAHLGFFPLPAGLAHAGDLAPQRQIAETDAAQLELAQRAAAAPAPLAAVVAAHCEFRLTLHLLDPALLRHMCLSSLLRRLVA